VDAIPSRPNLTTETEEQRTKIIRWVSTGDNVDTFHDEICNQRLAETGNWFLQGQTFREWRDSRESFLWVHGVPGCGKTVLCSSIIQHAVSFCSLRRNHHIGFFYFSFSDLSRSSTDSLARSVLRQLLLQRETLPDGVVDIYRRCGPRRPSTENWLSALRSVVKGKRQTYVIIDALDECSTQLGEQSRLVKFVKEMVNMRLSNLHVLATSRRNREIENALSQLGTFGPFGIQNAAVDEDILSYVKNEIRGDDMMKKWPDSLKQDVERELFSKAQGMLVCPPFDSLQEDPNIITSGFGGQVARLSSYANVSDQEPSGELSPSCQQH
jgi:ankyrin repeat domain-containing protein 50